MARHDEGFFTGKDNTRLFWTLDLPDSGPRAHVAIVHGYGDHIGRYRPVIDALVADGFAVHGFDYRGHGRADGRRAYAAKWTEFLDDLDGFWQRVRKAAGDQKIFLLAHSHGGLMAAHALTGRLEGLSGAILSAPYLKLAISPPAAKVLAARMVGSLVPWMKVPSGLAPDMLSTDPEIQKAVTADPLYVPFATPRWFVESTAAQAQTLGLAPKIQVPLFVLCGQEDGVALPAAARAFFEAAGTADKKFKEYPGMRHEPLNERDRATVFQDISGWISAHL
ncbi:alpha/beta hydrolase [Corallococcus sp. AB049A]|jgi:alpha-beta hydrolase superfamily lysophospholipase|uniref:Alpha/beta hydrolase n=1 Tax=Corallococcus interemptor TaxID=2316720 RepID=A0A3A8PYY5_9BACT|nr:MULTISPECIES: alpha/beta hydrolase [Corallococcus]RKH53412.1 alpha/beta hydrolase [Corallococcus sp. AB050B]RKH61679.1 alpha/beta hydrolase [Corallococcus interemptor]RKI44639.1 alpha/beta hydrolase [Corallococcus sp. AB049A]